MEDAHGNLCFAANSHTGRQFLVQVISQAHSQRLQAFLPGYCNYVSAIDGDCHGDADSEGDGDGDAEGDGDADSDVTTHSM